MSAERRSAYIESLLSRHESPGEGKWLGVTVLPIAGAVMNGSYLAADREDVLAAVEITLDAEITIISSFSEPGPWGATTLTARIGSVLGTIVVYPIAPPAAIDADTLFVGSTARDDRTYMAVVDLLQR